MKKTAIVSALALLTLNVTAQTKAEHQAIEQLCGCFEVTFNYAETFTTDTVNKYFAKELDTKPVLEYVTPIFKNDKKYELQHILVVNDDMMIKHWREDWIYENTDFWAFEANETWHKKQQDPASVKGQWTQTVWEVSDAPRYQGTSKWIENNGQTFWMNTTDAPLPRREYTKRRDYNVLNRTNRLQLTDYGYMHEQDNLKIVREKGKDQILSYEKGYNKYVRVADSKCEAAKKFWADKSAYWMDVRNTWDAMMNSGKTVKLNTRVDGMVMHEALDVSEKKNLKGTARKKDIEAVMHKYVTVS